MKSLFRQFSVITPAALCAVLWSVPAFCLAAEASEAAPAGPLEVVMAGGATAIVIILVLVLVSIAALALCAEHLLSIRRSELVPAGLAEQVHKTLSAGNVAEAQHACSINPSTLGVVLSAGLAEAAYGWNSVEQAMQERLDEESARLMRRIEYLSVIGNVAPMIGLLGTVFGMIFAFQEVANTQGAARAGELASGIYQALVTTVGGLIVAIPSLTAYAVFRNRVEAIVAETADKARTATAPLKQLLHMKPSGGKNP